MGRKFLARYKYVMEMVGFQLQDFDERRFKSFDFARSGLVLGVFVDIPRQLWYFVDQKRWRWAAALEKILVEGTACSDQRRFDDLMGRLENLTTIMPELVLRTARVRSILTDPKNKRGQLRKAEEHIRWVRALMRLFADGAISFARQSQEFKDPVIIHGDASGGRRASSGSAVSEKFLDEEFWVRGLGSLSYDALGNFPSFRSDLASASQVPG